ncbi:MAG: zinc ABC transporter substrate-binding protein [Saprospiraceae bacterium]|nr:zinc ABC transporter substrate-binding protein [Saprospiraceae bacterium]
MLRKYNLLIIAAVLLLVTVPALSQKLKVVATASMIADMAKQIGGDLIEVQCVVPIGGDPHIYEPTPGDAHMIAKADMILRNGLTFEGWLSELIENSGSKAKNVLVTQGIKAIESLIYENATDPHAWMDANNGLIYIKNIKEALIEADPGHRLQYEEQHDQYAKKLMELDRYIIDKIKSIPESKRILITSHDAFQYYGKRYGIRLESVLGTSTDAEVQTADIVRLNRVIKESGIPALFVESTINPKVLEQLAADNHLQIGGKLYADSIGDKGSPAPSYYDMLKHNTDVIANALSQPTQYISQKETSSPYSVLIYIFIGLIMLISLVFLIIKFNR